MKNTLIVTEKNKKERNLSDLSLAFSVINDGHSHVHRVTVASKWGEGGGARERWGSMKGEVKEVCLMFSPWASGTLFKKKKQTRRGGCGGVWGRRVEVQVRTLSMERRQEERFYRYLNINLTPTPSPPPPHIHIFFPPPASLRQSRYCWPV